MPKHLVPFASIFVFAACAPEPNKVINICSPGQAVARAFELECRPLSAPLAFPENKRACSAERHRAVAGFGGSDVETTTHEVDRGGNIVAPDNVQYTYRADGQVETFTLPESGGGGRFEYDEEGRVIRAVLEGGKAHVTYGWDGGLLMSERWGEHLFRHSYADELLVRIDGPAYSVELVRDEAGRVIEEMHRSGSAPTHVYNFSYDAASRLIEATIDLNQPERAVDGLIDQRFVRVYDDAGRLSAASFDYDLDGAYEDRFVFKYVCP